MSKLTAITSDFARAIEHLGTEHFVPTIADVLCGLVNADDATVIVYGHEELPTISFARPLAGKEESSLATYLTASANPNIVFAATAAFVRLPAWRGPFPNASRW